MAGVKAGCVHLCRVTLSDPIWQVTPRSSEMTCSGELYCLMFNL